MYAEGKGAALPTAEDVTRAGYKFMGWYEDSSFSGSAVTEISDSETGNKTFYAKWEKICTITVQSDGHGSVSASPTSAIIGAEITLTATPNTGYQFKAWEVVSGGVTITYNKFTMPAEDVTVKATFEAATYTVTLETNGGTIASGKEVTSYTYGEGATLPTTDDMTRTGYTFIGWYEDSSFSGSAVTEISGTETGNKTFYAKWAANTYTVTVQDDGQGSASASPISATMGEEITLTATPNTGYQFKAWEIISGGVTITGDKFTMPAEDVTVKAVFETIPPQTRIEKTEITKVPDGLKNTSFNTVTAIQNELTRTLTAQTGYTAANTATYDVQLQISTDGGNTWVDADETNFPTEGITIELPYPAGTGKNTHNFIVTHMFTVTSSRLGTTAGQTEQPTVRKTDSGIEVTLKGLSPVGIAWKAVDSGTGGGSGSGGSGGGDSDPAYYTLTFETNGGSGISAISATYGKTIDLSGYAPTRDGYDFGGWYSDKELTQKITEIKLNGSKTVYAGWTKHNPGTGTNPFTDVSTNDWFYDDVMFVYENGLMTGTSMTTFSPYANTTRAQIAVIFWRLDGSPAVEGKNSYTDVQYGPGTAWYYDAATWAQQNGIMTGYGDGRFGPDDPVTREQLAAIFYRYAQAKGYDVTATGSLERFTDQGDVSQWAQEAMKWAAGKGILNGRDNNILDPQGTATRAEIAAMLHRFIESYNLSPAATTTGSGGNGGGTSGWVQRTASPQTGDSFQMGLWLFTLCTSAGALIALLILKRRDEEESRQFA